MFGEGFILNIPTHFTIFGFNIYYYGLFITAGYTLAAVYLYKRRDLFGLTKDNILDLLLIAIPCGLVGARIYYMLFKFDAFFGPGQWGNILRFRDGGLAVYGGIIASGLVFIIYSRVKKIPIGNLLDAAGFGLFIGQAIGRWGNFINREAYGVETDLPWKMGLTIRGVTTYFHPAFIYEALWNVIGLLIIHIFSKKSKSRYPGQYFLFYVAWYGLGRFMIEGIRIDSLFIPGTNLRASQWLAAISFLAAVGILIYYHVRESKSDSSSVEDADDIGVVESADELAELDGASVEDIENESESDNDIEDTKELAELDGAPEDDADDGTDDVSENDNADGDSDDEIDAEDLESAEELADLDGASANEIENESEAEIPKNESTDKTEDKKKKTIIIKKRKR